MRHLPLTSPARLPQAPRAVERRTGLDRGDQEVRSPVLREVLRKLFQQAHGDARSVGAPVEREPIAGVRIRRGPGGREVRGIREDPVEAPEPAGEIRADHLDLKALPGGLPPEPGEGGPVPIGRHDPGALSGREQGRRPRSRSDLQHPLSRPRPGERQEELRVLPRRVDTLGQRGPATFLHASRIACESDARGNHLNISGPRTSH